MKIEKTIAKYFGNTYLKGYRYLIEACKIYQQERGHALVTEIYKRIAKKYNVKLYTVERNIRTYINKIYDFSDLNITITENRTNLEVISAIVKSIELEQK